MGLQSILSIAIAYLKGFSKQKIINAFQTLREQYFKLSDDHMQLQKEYEDIKDKYDALVAEKSRQKVQSVNQKVNRPTSKQPEWELKGVGNDGIVKKKGRGRKGRNGAGNKTKERPVTDHETAKVERCHICGKDLSMQAPLATENVRIIEDIPSLFIETRVIEVRQEKKYCVHCKQVTTARTELALPNSDIGLNTMVRVVYMWVSCCLPFTKICSYLNTFFMKKISTKGLSGMVIRIAKILKPVYGEILEAVKSSFIIHADESGWRVNGKLCWLWAFGNADSAYYSIDKSRGSDVVKKILGEIFGGVLIVDGWRAYQIIDCLQQSCMAHLLRKIRELYKTFPNLGSVFKFYIKFRKILRDGERLQAYRKKYGEKIFRRRLGKLHDRLDELLKWPNPNNILKGIISKVERQRSRILTFVEQEGVPCHNNFGEWLIRIGVLKRKVSYGSKSQVGAEAYAILLSIYTTCKLRKINFVDFLFSSLKSYIRTGQPMLLSEYISSLSDHSTHQSTVNAKAA